MSDTEDVYMCEDDEDYGLVSILTAKLYYKIYSIGFSILFKMLNIYKSVVNSMIKKNHN